MKNKTMIMIAAALCAVGCNFLETTPNVITKNTFYSSETEVKQGLVGVYGCLSNEAFYGNKYSIMLSYNDDLCYFNRSSTNSYTQWYTHDASASEIYDAWVQIYKGVRNANCFIEDMKNNEFDKDGNYSNEARFLRAYYHFILAQGWGDVPLKSKPTTNPTEVLGAATPQEDILRWVTTEMEACIEHARNNDFYTLKSQPSRVTLTTMQGILARVQLFMAGKTVEISEAEKTECLKKAKDLCKEVMDSRLHSLNPDYTNVFTNMIGNLYDTRYYESMWEVEFYGDRSSASSWSNGRIGDVNGLQSSPSSGFSELNCNYAYGQYNGSLKLWDLYWTADRTDAEDKLPGITDVRQNWNMSPYNYAGNTSWPPYGVAGLKGSGSSKAGMDKTPYVYNDASTTMDPLTAAAIRNTGKWRRESQYEGHVSAKSLYTRINFSLLRYSDILLMFAEASNELDGPTQDAYAAVKEVRDRARIATRPFAEYNQSSFRTLVRNERGRELCFESLRKYDLIRWGDFVTAMNDYVKWTSDERWSKSTSSASLASSIGLNVREKHILLPIPTIELGVNTELKQNKLWR